MTFSLADLLVEAFESRIAPARAAARDATARGCALRFIVAAE
jgi:hypothetical protein